MSERDETEPGRALTPKQERFVAEYLIDLNATQAATRAGYSAKTAQEQGSRLLSNAMVASAVERGISDRAERTRVTADRVVLELAKVGFSDMRKFSRWGVAGVQLNDSASLSDEDASCVAEVSQTITDGGGGTIKFKLHDKVGALTLLGKHLGLFTDKVEHSGTGLTIRVVRE